MKPGPKQKVAAAERRRRMSEKRDAERLQKILYADVRGKHGAFRAMLTNISRTGALLTITDQRFESITAHGDLGLAGLLIASHFGDGFAIELLEKPVRIEADVVRVSEERAAERTILWLGCQFRGELNSDACVAVGLRQAAPEVTASAAAAAPAAPAAPEAVQGPEVDPRLRVTLFDDVDAAAPSSIDAIKPRKAFVVPAAPLGKVRVFRTGAALGMREILEMAAERGASDVHAKGGSPVRIRVDGSLQELGDRPLDDEEAGALVQQLLSPEQFARFETKGDFDVAHTLEGGARFRVNVYRARGVAGLAARRIPDQVPTLEGLGLAPVLGVVAQQKRGLVLVAGPAGSGKSTTLAALVNHINQARACHILTMEDPIEFVHREARAQITQREIGDDTGDFAGALRRALRQDPDVIVVGATRDLDSIRLAVNAAEGGRLVFTTLHAKSAMRAIHRIVDAFPPEQQRQVRMQLAETLQGVVCQALLPRVGGGAAVAQEILAVTPAVRALIRAGKTAQIPAAIKAGADDGMQTLDDSLNDLVARGFVTYEAALTKAHDTKQIEREGKSIRRSDG